MKRSYYLFNPGRLSRRDNTLKFQPIDEHGVEGEPRFIPIEGVDNLYCFGSLDSNSAMYNFLGQQQIAVHFFDYYEHYTGSFWPKEGLLAGKVHVLQSKCYLDKKRRQHVALALIEGASFNILKNLRYYENRGKGDAVTKAIAEVEGLRLLLDSAQTIPELMGLEGNIRHAYYGAWEHILEGWEMGNRVKRPPSNEVNALISFGNTMCYTLAMDAIYHTQLNPCISFLHEPGMRRFSLALDVAEVFKPFLVDRLIFSMLNKKQLQKKDFDQDMGGITLKKAGRQEFVKAWDEKLGETIKHRSLGRNVSYRRLVQLECYKIQKYILGMEDEYKPFKIYW
jgi:CRISP-associated protein Cas1